MLPYALALGALVPIGANQRAVEVHLCCQPQNDLFRVLSAAGVRCARHDTPAEAVERAPEGAGVLILAGGYPGKPTATPLEVFARARFRRLGLYVEYPSALPDLEVGAPRGTGWTQGWIVAVLGLRRMRTSFWELTAGSRIGEHLDRLKPLSFPGGDQAADR